MKLLNQRTLWIVGGVLLMAVLVVAAFVFGRFTGIRQTVEARQKQQYQAFHRDLIYRLDDVVSILDQEDEWSEQRIDQLQDNLQSLVTQVEEGRRMQMVGMADFHQSLNLVSDAIFEGVVYQGEVQCYDFFSNGIMPAEQAWLNDLNAALSALRERMDLMEAHHPKAWETVMADFHAIYGIDQMMVIFADADTFNDPGEWMESQDAVGDSCLIVEPGQAVEPPTMYVRYQQQKSPGITGSYTWHVQSTAEIQSVIEYDAPDEWFNDAFDDPISVREAAYFDVYFPVKPIDYTIVRIDGEVEMPVEKFNLMIPDDEDDAVFIVRATFTQGTVDYAFRVERRPLKDWTVPPNRR